MGYQLDIASDVETWLAGTRESDPETARQVSEALDTLRAEGAALGPPLVVPVDYDPGRRGVAVELDYSYRRRMEAVTRVRRETSEVATLRKDLEDHLGEAMTDDQRAVLQGAYDAIRAQEEKITQVSRRLHEDLTAFSARKETLRASLLAAVIEELTMLADVSLASGDTHLEHPSGELMELRPGAPAGIVARVLFTAESPETALVLAAAAERDVLSAWYDRVVPPTYVPQASPAPSSSAESNAAG